MSGDLSWRIVKISSRQAVNSLRSFINISSSMVFALSRALSLSTALRSPSVDIGDVCAEAITAETCEPSESIDDLETEACIGGAASEVEATEGPAMVAFVGSSGIRQS
jgi:hypothetical protein